MKILVARHKVSPRDWVDRERDLKIPDPISVLVVVLYLGNKNVICQRNPMVERGALDAIFAEQNLSAQGLTAGRTSSIQGVRYLVIGKLTQVQVTQPGGMGLDGALRYLQRTQHAG